MLRFIQYYGQFQGFKGRFGGLPGWARGIVALLALPGVILLALSLLAFGISILALLLLTVPAYRLLSVICGTASVSPQTSVEPEHYSAPSGRRHVDVKIIEPQ
jgi:hypothetical protein